MFAPYYARIMEPTVADCVTVTKDGKERIATYQRTTASFPTARDTGNVIKEYARVTRVGRETTVI